VALPQHVLAATGAAARPAADPAAVRIHDIQGTTRLSPYAGKAVADVPGIVTGTRAYGGSKGFWIQDPKPDDNPATSEGVFVYTGSNPTVAVGDSVRVSGTVSEYYPGGTAAGDQSVTEIGGKPTVTVESTGNALPAPVKLDAADIPAAYAPPGDTADKGSIERLTLRPTRYALDYFESLEGMNVEVENARVVGPTDAYAELWVTVKPRENPTPRGGTLYRSYDTPNTGRVQIQSQATDKDSAFPRADVGDKLSGATTGPLDFNDYGGYTLVAGHLGTVTSGGLRPETTRKQHGNELAVATYNVENLAPSDGDAKFARLAQGVVKNLASPDIVALEEIQDNDGATDDGVVAADQTIAKFTAAIKAAGGPSYQAREIDPANDQDGGEPGGNIRSVFLFNPARVSFVDRSSGDATTADGVEKVDGKAELTRSPGRIAPTDAAWKDSRKPLAGQFTFRGKPVIVIANHFDAKLGDFPLTSRVQPPTRPSETQRLQQATLVNAFVRKIRAAQPGADVVVLGDLNDYQFSATDKELTSGGALTDLYGTLPADQRYSYVYQGDSQVLDHILTTPALARRADYDVVHVNAEFADQVSDHDPQIVRLRP
jgi:predicted extracellular nuclease